MYVCIHLSSSPQFHHHCFDHDHMIQDRQTLSFFGGYRTEINKQLQQKNRLHVAKQHIPDIKKCFI